MGYECYGVAAAVFISVGKMQHPTVNIQLTAVSTVLVTMTNSN